MYIKEELEEQVEASLKMKVTEIEKAKKITMQIGEQENINDKWAEKFFDMIIEERTSLFWAEHLKSMEQMVKAENATNDIQEQAVRQYMNFFKNNVTFFPFGSESYKKLMEIKSRYDKHFKDLEDNYKKADETQVRLDEAFERMQEAFNAIDNLEELEEARGIILDGNKDEELENKLLDAIEKRKLEIQKSK